MKTIVIGATVLGAFAAAITAIRMRKTFEW